LSSQEEKRASTFPPSLPPSLPSYLDCCYFLTTLLLPPSIIRDDSITKMHFFASVFSVGRRKRPTRDPLMDNRKTLLARRKLNRTCQGEGGLEGGREGGKEGME